MFQSSTMSWSSKIMALGTVDMIQRSDGSDHDSWYSQVYSSKLATISGGRSESGGRKRSLRCLAPGEESSA